MTTTTENARQTLRTAAKLVKQGWSQGGDAAIGEKPCFGAAEAIREAREILGYDAVSEAVSALIDYLTPNYGYNSVVAFNDARHRTQFEVAEALWGAACEL